jgi:hypothetical protein
MYAWGLGRIGHHRFFGIMDSSRDHADDVLDRFHPAVSSWFREQFGEPTPAQRLGWPASATGQNALIVAPTGSPEVAKEVGVRPKGRLVSPSSSAIPLELENEPGPHFRPLVPSVNRS